MKNALLVIMAILCIVAIMSLITVEDRVIIYDCRLAEFHPDFPVSVKEECRKLLKDNIPKYNI